MVTTIELPRTELAELRFGFSPLLELVFSFHMLELEHWQSGLYYRWLEEAQQAIHGQHYPLMKALIGHSGYIPDFITPTPNEPMYDLQAEFQQILNTPAEIIQEHVDLLQRRYAQQATLPPLIQEFLQYPHEYLPCLIDEMYDYWQRTLAPYWSRMTSILENDILHHSRTMVITGAEQMLTELTPSMKYQQGKLELYHHNPKKPDAIHPARGDGLQLVPAIFGCNHLSYQVNPHWRTMVIYTSRGAGLWHYQSPEPSEALELTLGAGKARLLLALADPLNTTELAHKLTLTAGAVSQQLKNLTLAGLVESHRHGKNVFYRLTERGTKLVGLF